MSGDSDSLRDLRSLVCHLAADWLAEAGQRLWVDSWATKDHDSEAVALVAQMVGQLGQEAADAFDRERWYAATALTRQIVEAHYLMAAFRDDPPQRQRWLNASTNRIEKSFRPSQMRQAGGFRPSEYKQHCTWGGHPGPSARWLLPNHDGNVHPGILVADLATHLTEAADLFASAVNTLPNAPALAGNLPSQGDLPDAYSHWRTEDPFAGRFILPASTANSPVAESEG
ncbi:hypothetical protein [Arthrobacter sp. FW306-2-2C-D06B]|uniref:hypothetical protein n=1 Tax=Arthrobacter sp. FW306-2-2C-D06B TaxID=2879618 RepID=UPI001F1BA670|nr:hypothetical protein [Arthrobacter sp. FW306-2-2C-D06B]UKA56947.1 hypothetical protein LFT47_11505 [Arthrobacter sp. FW306-2-2C-D06B]